MKKMMNVINLKPLCFLACLCAVMFLSTLGTYAGGKGKQTVHDQTLETVIPARNPVQLVLSYLTPGERVGLASPEYFESKNAQNDQDAFYQELEEKLGKFIELPAVTETDCLYLKRELRRTGKWWEGRTSIQPMPAFRVAEAKTSIGLYHLVMKRYPPCPHYWGELYRDWKANPDLPLTNTTLKEDEEFVDRLNKLTGRKFFIMNDAQNEYSIRGRHWDWETGKYTGRIVASEYFFGDGDWSFFANHMWYKDNSEGRVHGVHERARYFKNNFGLIHPVGNVWSRSIDRILRGGAFDTSGEQAASVNYDTYDEGSRRSNVGLRLAEEIP